MFSQMKVETNSQSSWYLYKQLLLLNVIVSKDDIKLKTQSIQKKKEPREKAFQRSMYKIKTYINPFEQNNDQTQRIYKIEIRSFCKQIYKQW